MAKKYKQVKASLDSLHRIFTVPEASNSKLSSIEKAISKNLNSFLQDHVPLINCSLTDIEKDFCDPYIPEQTTFVSDHTEFLLEKLIAQSVHTSSPRFIGHMTSALPYFLMPLSKIMIALNQNTVKIETSKAFTPLERQVLGMLHNLIYQRDANFYNSWMHSSAHSLGAFCSGGTIANITALWVARNNQLKPEGNFKGVAEEGISHAMRYYGYKDLVVLVSERGHYSLKKSADILGIGQHSLIAIPTDDNNRIHLDKLEAVLIELKENNIKPFALVGVAGTTETGNIDPLDKMADIAERECIHFHVDAAWGGASLMSNKQRPKLKGIERADSVTIDAHKQLYVPMGTGMVLFKDPSLASAIEHHADYILRKSSKDLGCHTLEGSRSGITMLLFFSLKIIGRQGYELLIDQSVDKAMYFAELIKQKEDFELVSAPELCLLTYRYLPTLAREALALATSEQTDQIHALLNTLTIFIQKRQREMGYSFVSRTRLTPSKWNRRPTDVFRVVLANPLTTHDILNDVLEEQRVIAQQSTTALPTLIILVDSILSKFR
ncbi:pyridoxal-dependent aspartate 1-decarboxylase PanP [Candidatus Enterovibrio escicola]|uniref:Glutamate decarboxylase, eukaryotic type n=1 Tax=Candidatus Enterovibrio escicola TaxID=1927127 RepID=A0A2A5T454_9GAMM|nr:putative pyridoxal-dependent aspartate 1-decarboxylase [Candidatus Enterovibrio escacola]PCS22942.1 Glutamate decarboxylase, eukaryotic type [Candidatus Enterovibrio escacola]